MNASMKLCCPLCGGETATGAPEGFACEKCGGWLKMQPNGKAWILLAAERELPHEAEALKFVTKSEQVLDPKKRRQLLDRAFAICPDSLEVNKAILMFGQLDQLKLRKPDNHYIKCYLLHLFDEPEEETAEQQEQMLKELTEAPQLLKCLSLAADKEAFWRDYCRMLCRDYVGIFLKGSNNRNGTLMGFQIMPLERALAAPVANMLVNMQRTPLPEPLCTDLPQALREVYETDVGRWLFVEQELGRRMG